MQVNEAATKGVINALAKNRSHTICKSCGFALPKYPGRYPARCPNCGADLEKPTNADRPAT